MKTLYIILIGVMILGIVGFVYAERQGITIQDLFGQNQNQVIEQVGEQTATNTDVYQQEHIAVSSQDYLDDYFTFNFEKINENLWRGTLHTQPQFLADIKFCYGKNINNNCWDNLINTYFSDPVYSGYTKQELKAEMEGMANYPIQNLSDGWKFNNFSFDINTGTANFDIIFPNGFQLNQTAKFGYNSTFVWTTNGIITFDDDDGAPASYIAEILNTTGHKPSFKGTLTQVDIKIEVTTGKNIDAGEGFNVSHCETVACSDTYPIGGLDGTDLNTEGIFWVNSTDATLLARFEHDGADSEFLKINETADGLDNGEDLNFVASVWLVYTNDPPNAVFLNTTNNTAFTTSTPTLNFTGTDNETEDLEYNIQVDPTNTFNSSSGTSIFRYDAHLNTVAGFGDDPNTVWSNDDKAFDGIIDSNELLESKVSTSGDINTNYLYGKGTNSSDNGYTISQVRVRVYTRSDVAVNKVITYYTSGLGESLGSITINSAPRGWSSYTTLSTPTGGWDWDKLSSLEIKFYISGNINSEFFTTELEVTTTAPLIDNLSSSDSGFFNTVTPSDTHPFTQGNMVNYTVQTSLADGTYYWRVRASEGTNGYGDWSDIGNFMITSEDTTPPKWSSNSTNSTISGTWINHSVVWTDSGGLSNYTFSFDNGTGSFTNDSSVGMTGTSNQSYVLKYVNETVGSTIRWIVYSWDLVGNANNTATFTYTTTTAQCWSMGPGYLYIPNGCQFYLPPGESLYIPPAP